MKHYKLHYNYAAQHKSRKLHACTNTSKVQDIEFKLKQHLPSLSLSPSMKQKIQSREIIAANHVHQSMWSRPCRTRPGHQRKKERKEAVTVPDCAKPCPAFTQQVRKHHKCHSFPL